MTGAGIEPAARALKVRCSTTELPSPWPFAQNAFYFGEPALPFIVQGAESFRAILGPPEGALLPIVEPDSTAKKTV